MMNYYNSEPIWARSNKDGFASALALSLIGKTKNVIGLLMFAFLTFSQLSNAQSTANYTFLTNTTGSLALDMSSNPIDMTTGTTLLVAADTDDAVSSVTNIGFNFFMYGNLFTQFSASSNGVIHLGSSTPSTTQYVLSGGSTTTPRIGAFAADLRTGISGKVHSKIVGTAPNRCLVIEFLNMSLTYVATPGSNDGTYQVRIYENSGNIEYVYGSMFRNASTTTTAAIYSGFSVGSAANTTASITTSTNTVSTGATFNLNSYTNSVNIPNLHSTADGSRRVYQFIPPGSTGNAITPVIAAPTALTFTAVTGSTTTLNWVASAPTANILKYAIFASTDGGTTYNFVATTNLGTNTYAATGLSPGLTYTWKIYAISEGGKSTDLTGVQATLTGATYYWVGTTGGLYDLASNWNTAADGTGLPRTTTATSDILIVDGNGTTPGGATTIVVNIASFSIGQFKVTSNTACTLESDSTTTRTITLIGGPGEDFTVEAGSTLNLVNATNAVAFAFSGDSNTGKIGGTLNASGNTANRITTTGGTNTMVIIDGTAVVNNSIPGASGCLTGSVATLSFVNGSSYTHSSYTTTDAYIPTATWGASATANLTGGTTGTGLTSGSTSLGNLIVNTTTLAGTLSAFTTSTRTIQGNLTIQATGTGRFRCVTSGVLSVLGNIVVNGGILDIASAAAGGVISGGTTTINAAGTIDLNTGILQQNGPTFTNDGTLTGLTSTASLNFFSAANTAQTLAGSGTIATNIGSLGINNAGNVTITHTNPITLLRVNLFKGTFINSNKITMGTGAALAVVTQVGSTAATTPGGFFDQSPVWNLGTGTYSILYLQESVARTTGFEINPTRILSAITVNNTNGLTINGGDVTATTTLALTNGIVTTGTNTLTLGNATTVGTLTGGSATAYVNGKLSRSIASANTNTTFVTYPIGKAGVYTPIALAPATTSIALFSAESFGSNTGTADSSVNSLSTTRRFEALPVSGTFTSINVRLSDAGMVTGNVPVQAPSANGVYSAVLGSPATFAAGPPITITSVTPLSSANYTGYLSYGNSNACAGTPIIGATTALPSVLCFGSSTTLALTTNPIGTGISYLWQSSPDNVTYTNIPTATSSSYTATPTAPTWYQCIVTCSAGPASATSTPILVTFANTVATTTPGSVCGSGTVTLAATPSAGATINWYAAATGGAALNTGNTFVTPVISANTTYYAEATVAGVVENGAKLAAVDTSGFLTTPGWGVVFNATTSFTLNSTTIYPSGTGTITIALINSAGTEIAVTPAISITGSGISTPVVVPLNFYIPVGTGYKLTMKAYTGISDLIRDSASNSFPYNSPSGALSVTSGWTATATSTSYYWFYKFNISTGCSSPRVPVLASISTPPTLTLSSAAVSICSGQTSAPVTVTAGASDYNTYTFLPATGVSGTAATGFSFNPTATTTYTLTASQTSGTLCSTVKTITVTVNPLPSAITIAPVTAVSCANSIQPLTATGGTIVVNASGVIGNATTFTDQATITDPTVFCNRYDHTWQQLVFTQAELNAAGIQAGNINALKFNISTIGSAANVTDFRIFMGSTTQSTLTGFISTGLSQVFAVASYSQTLGVNTITLNTPYAWDGTSNIVVDIRNTGIDSTNNAATFYTATTDNKAAFAYTSVAAGSSNAFVATNPTATLSLKRMNVTFDWSAPVQQPVTWSPVTNLYTDALATTPYTGTAATTVYHMGTAATAATVYTATATSASNCPSTATTSITVNAPVAAPTATAQPFCNSATVANLTATGTAIQWYAASTGGTPLASTVALTSTTYYATQTVSGCESPRTPVAVTINSTVAPTATAQTFCGSATVANLTATGTGIQWYANSTGGTPLASTVALTATTYYATQTISGCESPRTPVAVTINVTTAPTAASPQTFTAPATIANIVVTGTTGTVIWYPTSADAIANTNPIATSTTLVNNTTYYVTQTIAGCPSAPVAVLVNVTLRNNSFDMSSLNYYPNPTVDVVNISYTETISSIEVYNLVGQMVKSMKPNATSTQLDMSNLPTATYLVKVTSEGKTADIKIVKK